MALKQCPECHGQVSSSAKACPHCGHRLPGSIGDNLVNLLIITGLIVTCISWGFFIFVLR